MPRSHLSAVAFCLSTLAASSAAAHIALTDPAPRRPDQKVGPCGIGANDARGPNVTTFQGGETITVRWTETVEHPGHFRISFDPDGQDDFVDPAGYDDYYTNAAVLVDQIEDKVGFGQTYAQEVTLPLMSCDNCTLQLVQVMTDKPPYEIGTNDLYYQCADIVLVGDEETTGEATTGGTSEGTGGDATSGDATTGGTSGSGNATEPTSGGGGTTGGSSGGDSSAGGDTEDFGPIDTCVVAAPPGFKGRCDPVVGCGCRGDASDGGVAALVLFGWLWRRRRAATRRNK